MLYLIILGLRCEINNHVISFFRINLEDSAFFSISSFNIDQTISVPFQLFSIVFNIIIFLPLY